MRLCHHVLDNPCGVLKNSQKNIRPDGRWRIVFQCIRLNVRPAWSGDNVQVPINRCWLRKADVSITRVRSAKRYSGGGQWICDHRLTKAFRRTTLLPSHRQGCVSIYYPKKLSKNSFLFFSFMSCWQIFIASIPYYVYGPDWSSCAWARVDCSVWYELCLMPGLSTLKKYMPRMLGWRSDQI